MNSRSTFNFPLFTNCDDIVQILRHFFKILSFLLDDSCTDRAMLKEVNGIIYTIYRKTISL